MGFSSCHPAINLLYFACVISVTLAVSHPILLGIGLVCACSYTIRLNRRRGSIFAMAMLPLVVLFAVSYASTHHFGATVLFQNAIGNNVTLESAVYGLILGVRAASILIWFSCIHTIFTADKVIYLFGRVSPRLSLFLAILLRIVPRVKAQAKKINTARKGIGRGSNQGNFLRKARNWMRIVSILITWAIEMLGNVSDSMRSRGSTLRGRTAFSIYRFDNRDRSFVVGLVACMTLLVMGLMLLQGSVSYDPVIRMNPLTPMSWIFYGGYALFCLAPLFLDICTELSFHKARQAI